MSLVRSKISKVRCLLFTSRDTDFIYEYAKNVISREFELLQTWRFSRSSANLDTFRNEIESFKEIDYVFNFLSPKLFPIWLINLPKIGCVNFHPASSEYPGVGGASLSIYDNREEYGVTAHFMTEKIDAGKIIAERSFAQESFDNCSDLFERALQECCLLLDDTISLLKRDHRPPSINYWKREAITRREFEEWMILKPSDSLEEFSRKVRALKHPKFPGPYIKVDRFIFSYFKEEI